MDVLNNKSGFTLMEIIITISLITILISAGTQGIQGFTAYIKLEGDMRKLYSQFLQARQLAIIKQKDYGIIFDKKKRIYKLVDEEMGISSNKLNDGIKFGNISFGTNNQVTFKPGGTARGGHVEISNNFNRKYKIIVSPHTGRVRYERDT